jgi:transcriptional regulator with XRE-family HTH domain
MEHQNFKPYGLWQREERKKQGLTLQELANKSQLNASTLSRIEKQKLNAMFSTGVRICQALGVTPGELAHGIFVNNEHYVPNSDGVYPCEAWQHTPLHQGIRRETVVQMDHLGQLIDAFDYDPKQIRDVFLHLVREVVTAHEQLIDRSKDDPDLAATLKRYNLDKRDYELSDDYVYFLLSKSPYDCFPIEYPDALTPETLVAVFQQGGVLLDEDMDFFLKQSAVDFRLQIYKMMDPDLAVTAQRLEVGDVSSVFMEDVLRLEQKENTQGKLIARYWYSTMMQYFASPRFSEPWEQRWHTHWTKRLTRIAKNYVLLTRWLYVYGYSDFSSLHESLWKLDTIQRPARDPIDDELGEEGYLVYDPYVEVEWFEPEAKDTRAVVKNPLYYPHFRSPDE